MTRPNLNRFAIPMLDDGMPLLDSHGDGATRVHLRNIKRALLEQIESADAVIGCVAWLTDFDLLRALKRKQVVSLLIQKEDFLRPESASHANFHSDLRAAYSALPTFERGDMPSLVAELSTAADPTSAAVRCVGFAPGGTEMQPRMHHKFCVFARVRSGHERPGYHQGMAGTHWDRDWIEPYAAWTGSFNWTLNASASLENAIFTTDKVVVQNFTKEWGNCFALSEPLDWTTTYVAPEYRVGS